MIERDDEMDLLRETLSRAAEGKGGVAVISGPVATGKTELLNAFAEHATDSGAMVLGAACSQAEASMPFGAIAQAFQHAPIAPEHLQGMSNLINQEDCLNVLGDSSTPTTDVLDQVYPSVMNYLWRALLDLSEQRPVVIVVDDVDQADRFSLQGLSFIARRLRSARVVVVLAAQTGTRRTDPFLQSEVLRQPLWQQIRLGPLSEDGVAGVLESRFGADTARRVAPEWFSITRGNPLLVRALLEDDAPGGHPVPGESFAEAMSACLHRCDPDLADLAVVVAVLGEQATTELVADLVGTPHEAVAPKIRALNAVGVLADGRFTHAVGCAAMLDPLDPAKRTDLHLRAAEKLFYAGTGPTAVAELLLAAGEQLPEWSTTLLQEAGDRALLDDEVEKAVKYLELAYRTATSRRDQVVVLNLLISAHWRTDPLGCTRYVDRMLEATRDGFVDGNVSLVVKLLLGLGRYADTEMLLERVATQGREVPLKMRVERRFLRLMLAYHTPGLLSRVRPELLGGDRDADELAVEVTMSPRMQAIRVLEVALAGGNPDEAVEHAEHVLQGCRLGDGTADMLFTMLAVLVDLDRGAAALPWCESMMAEAEARKAWAWLAILLSVRADLALQAADFTAAAEYAQRALTTLPPENWGLLVGKPLATLLQANTALGRLGDAAALLKQPVPELTFQTTFGLQYWLAKGQYYLSTNRLHAALVTFQACGELSTEWDVDVVAWRGGTAEVLMRTGKADQARTLLREQLSRVHRGNARVRGVSLRLLARTVDLVERPRLLKEAIEQLQNCGALLDQAHALADLSIVLQRLGDSDRSRIAVRRAWLLAKKCNANLPGERRPAPPEDELRHPVAADPAGDSSTTLSDAEQRVAALAARGAKNQDIAAKLSITVSTVEQHLTRVYRKLKVSRRTDLPGALDLLAVDSALSAVGSY
ncbi:AAA family ATPase [Lentzea sp. NPDC060358]|uniref:helix-turn-helix transcriptional regulator n=1 Tax=Lentzea sp. NPDC060358 TaxID=3347103 RepID=UPI003661A9FB